LSEEHQIMTSSYRNGTKIKPDFKLMVAGVCRAEARIFADQQRHEEAAAKLASAERLERQAADQLVEDALEVSVWETHQIREPA
jgi:hypothetical protein